MQVHSRITLWLICGDALAALILAVVGYLMHYAGIEPFSLRWLSTFLPFCLGWAIAAVPAGLYQAPVASRWQQAVWRAALAGALAAPFATMLRGLYLNAAVSPVFMLVLTANAALAMAVWRGAWSRLAVWKKFYG
jgi:glucose uptake protein GlcU